MDQKGDLKSALNSCKAGGYTRIADLRDNVVYPIRSFERVDTPYGEAVMATLEGLTGDDPLRIYLPRRYLAVLGDHTIGQYNVGVGTRMSLVKRSGPTGSKGALIEFV